MPDDISTNIEGECDQCGETHGNLRHLEPAGVYLCRGCLDTALTA